jgi:hypothetical protein
MVLVENGERRLLPIDILSLTRCVTVRPSVLRRGAPFGLCVVVLTMLGCESTAVIASWSCPQSSETSGVGSAGAAGAEGTADSFALPWSTGFESGFCDYEDGRGPCISNGSSHYSLVSEPVHSGDFAAAFTVNATGNGGQARCIREGSLPAAARYGAWYYVPVLAKNQGLWNLIHFQGDNEDHGGHLWDVSLGDNDSGDLCLVVFNYWLDLPDQSKNPPIPIGTWFHIEMYLKRATDETGEVIVYQDGVVIFQLTNVETDNSSSWTQWYVGNLADNLDPIDSTLYVDDITISATH